MGYPATFSVTFNVNIESPSKPEYLIRCAWTIPGGGKMISYYSQ